jgi:hypothetical protein
MRLIALKSVDFYTVMFLHTLLLIVRGYNDQSQILTFNVTLLFLFLYLW